MKKTLLTLILSFPLALSCTSAEKENYEFGNKVERKIVGYGVEENTDSLIIRFENEERYVIKIKDYERAITELRNRALDEEAENLFYFINGYDPDFPKTMSDEERLKAYPSALFTLKILDRNQDNRIDDKDKIMILMSPWRSSIIEHLRLTNERFSSLRYSEN